MSDARFWTLADDLIRSHRMIIDRPKNTAHPRYPKIVYPLDYGYVEGTTGGDGEGVDCWRGSLPETWVVGAIMTVDHHKKDCEIKWLIGCTPSECDLALATHQTEWQAAILIRRGEAQ